MKHWMKALALTGACLTMALAACKAPALDAAEPAAAPSPVTIEGAAAQIPSPAVLPEETSLPENDDQALETADGELTAILTEIAENYHQGTAGCSLTAARFAGMLLDYDAARHPEPDGLAEGVKAFCAGLSHEGKMQLINEQMGDIYSAAVALTEENALDYLDSAGYTPASYPWTAEQVNALFTAVYAGLGAPLPA